MIMNCVPVLDVFVSASHGGVLAIVRQAAKYGCLSPIRACFASCNNDGRWHFDDDATGFLSDCSAGMIAWLPEPVHRDCSLIFTLSIACLVQNYFILVNFMQSYA